MDFDLRTSIVDVKQHGGTLQRDHAAPEVLLSQPEVEAEHGGLQTRAVVGDRVPSRPPATRLSATRGAGVVTGEGNQMFKLIGRRADRHNKCTLISLVV